MPSVTKDGDRLPRRSLAIVATAVSDVTKLGHAD